MRILFMGTPDFAVQSLKALIDGGFEIVGVVSQPDKKKGRGMELSPTPVKELAGLHCLPVFQPERLKDEAILPLLEELKPDIIIVVAYGKILPKYILEFPKYGCINVHGSLLPKYRGAAPIQWAVINGEKETGITTMRLSEGMDEGDILLSKKVEIGEYETSGELFERLSSLGAEVLIETINTIDSIVPQKQDHAEATYAKMLDKSISKIDFSHSAREIVNLIRGLNPWPLSVADSSGGKFKIISAVMGKEMSAVYGTVLGVTKDGMEIACGDGKSILATVIQFENAKKMTPDEYFRGHKSLIGERLL